MFVSESFKVPNQLYTGQFHFQVLGPKFSEVDYEAVMSSRKRLHHVFAEKNSASVYRSSVYLDKTSP